MISTPVGVPSVSGVVDVENGGVSDGLVLVSVDVRVIEDGEVGGVYVGIIVSVIVSELCGTVRVMNDVAVEVVVDVGSVETDGVDDPVSEEGVDGRVEELGSSLVSVIVGVTVIVMTVSVSEVLGAGVVLAELDLVADGV
ncbi:hypothetical protein RRF57_000835 [Xylaria bambusicola]|uniref:Uncharacterized protein n=1 Tax=Xylaria bambusicola TaxID=326684 RepID=A0AAN7UAI3_9PEZI